MKDFEYSKFYNSSKTTEDVWNKLSLAQQKKLTRIFNKLREDLKSFKDQKDAAFSLLHHLIDDKIEIVEEEVVIKKLKAKQIQPFNKIESIDLKVVGEVKW